MRTKTVLAAAIGLSWIVASHAQATVEICGNDIDDDGNGLTDEGCYPTLTTGVCESPLSCGDTGMISWSTGSLHYDLPPDIAPAVPFGPGVGMRRFYLSQFSPGANPTSVNKTPLGPNWGHTYLTYVDKYTVSMVKYAVLHTSQGRDVLYTYLNTASGWDVYTPQYGEHVMSLKVNTASPYQTQVQLLTGETIVYNSYGQLSEIWDTEAPTPNKVLVTWDATTNGNVSTVTDANNKRRLLFSYAAGLMTSVQFQTFASSVWTTQHTTSYGYSGGATRDATSGWFVPASAAEWTELLAGTGISNPSHLWLLQESSGTTLADSIGSATLTLSAGSLAQTVTGWSRKATTFVDNTTSNWFDRTFDSNLGNPGSGPCTLLSLIAITAQPAAERTVALMGDGNGMKFNAIPSGGSTLPKLVLNGAGTPTTATGSSNIGTMVRPWVIGTDGGTSPTYDYLMNDLETVSPTATRSLSSANSVFWGGAVQNSAPQATLYAAEWASTGLTSTQAATLINRLKTGYLTSVTIGGQLAQTNVYTSNGYLSQIVDGSSNQIVAFAYDSTTAGKVVRVDTSRGTVGFEYSSTRTGCTGNTMLYFNKGNATSCSVDSDCGTGYLCGGKTGTGTTGTCFLAGRCLTTSTVNGESVVTNVAPIGSGGTCTGACTDVMQYVWATTSVGKNPAGLFDVAGREDALGNYTSVLYNSNGLPIQIGYGDTGADPTLGNYARTVYYYYDSVFPGRIAEVRRASDLSGSSSSCTYSVSTGCARTFYTYGSDNQLHTVEQE